MSGELLFWLNLLVGVGIYALLAVSLNLINGHAGMFNLGHHGFWALGAYAAVWIIPSVRFLGQYDAGGDGTVTLAEFRQATPEPAVPDERRFAGMDGDHDGELSTAEIRKALDSRATYAYSLLFAMAVAAIGGLAIGIPCLRLRGDYLAIATLGFGEIVRIAVQNSPERVLGGSLGIQVPRLLMDVTPTTLVPFRLLTLAIVAALCAATILAFRNFLASRPGRHLLAVAQDETAAGLLGINPTRSKVTAFVMGSSVAGLAGGLYAHYQGFITPLDFGFMEMVKMFLIIVLGGMGSLSGCVVGAFLVVATEQLLNRAPKQIAAWWQVEFPLILAVMIIFRPQGIFGRREITDIIARAWRGRAA